MFRDIWDAVLTNARQIGTAFVRDAYWAYFLQTRYYNPEWRRFLNADVLFIAGDMLTGANMYAYCNGNPVMYCDPSGMNAVATQLGQAIALGLLVGAAAHLLTTVGNLSYGETEKYLIGLNNSSTSYNKYISTLNNIINALSGQGSTQFIFEGLGSSRYGTPNSGRWVDELTYRYFGPDGRALWDDHYGHQHHHPHLGPRHRHEWDWSAGGKPGDAMPSPEPNYPAYRPSVYSQIGNAFSNAYASLDSWWFMNKPAVPALMPNTGDIFMRMFPPR